MELEENKTEENIENKEEKKEEQPKAVSQEELSTLREQVAQLRGALDQANATSNNRQQQQPAKEEPIQDVSDEELDDIITQGAKGGAKKIRQAINAALETRFRVMEKRINEMESFGINSLGELSEKVAASDMPYQKHSRIGKIIKDEIKKMRDFNPSLIVNSKILKAVHDRVVGENIEELTQEKIETAARQTREKTTGSLPGQNNGRDNNDDDKNKIPSVVELLGEDAQLALTSKGQTADEFSKRLGYANWEAYVKVIQSQRAA